MVVYGATGNEAFSTAMRTAKDAFKDLATPNNEFNHDDLAVAISNYVSGNARAPAAACTAWNRLQFPGVLSVCGGSGGGGGCAISVPSNVDGYLVNLCVNGFQTQYTMTWTDQCPGQTGWYEVWARQPDTAATPYTYRWSTVVPSASVFVSGQDGRGKVKACNGGGGGCTQMSSTSFLAQVRC